MTVPDRPARWQKSDEALRAAQIAFDVETAVLEAVRRAAFEHNLSTSDEIRRVLGLSVSARPKRPRLTVTLTPEDYVTLAARYGLDAQDRLAVKEQVTQTLINFAARRRGRT